MSSRVFPFVLKFSFTDCMHNKGTRSQSSKTLVVPLWRNNQGKRTFHYRGAKIWNTLPANIRTNFNDMSMSYCYV